MELSGGFNELVRVAGTILSDAIGHAMEGETRKRVFCLRGSLALDFLVRFLNIWTERCLSFSVMAFLKVT